MNRSVVAGGLTLALAWDWTNTLSLIFGGCCSNALTLEKVTSEYPHVGGLITFAHFLFITLHGLPKFVQFTPYPRLRPRKIPILPYLIQVVLFYLISLLNNAAFAYRIPMPVHIVFRSGGLILNMAMGWLLQRKQYHPRQIVSVIVVTVGVILTTLSAITSKSKQGGLHAASQSTAAPTDIRLYLTGIFILFVALLLSSVLGIVQDLTYAAHRDRVANGSTHNKGGGGAGGGGTGISPTPASPSQDHVEPWKESMFYLHFLSMPMFLTMRQDLSAQFQSLMLSPRVYLTLPTTTTASIITTTAPGLSSNFTSQGNDSFFSPFYTMAVPSALIFLCLNTVTQLVCVAGVHRLTSRVTSLTVTLVLVVRKSVSLMISVFLYGDRYSRMDTCSRVMMLGGAALVFAGTLAYSLVPKQPQVAEKGKDKTKTA